MPPGWTHATGDDVFEFVTSGSRGWAQHYSDRGAMFLRIGNLDHGTIDLDLAEVQHVDPPGGAEGERTRLRPNDILVSITAELGMIGRVPPNFPEAYINQHIALARPRPEYESRYVAWYLASEVDGRRQLQELRRGATKAGLGLNDIRGVRIPLAPVPEQKRIADKLDALLARVDACRDRLDRLPANLKRFRQSVLAAAISGELTREWREEQGRPTAGFDTSPLRELVREPLRNGKSVRDGSGPLVLRLSSLKNGAVEWREAKQGEWGDIAVERFLVEEGDFLVARGNGTREFVGRGALVVGVPPRVAFPDTMIRVRLDPTRIVPKFLKLVWDAAGTRRQIESSARTTAGIWKVAQPDLEGISIPTPTLNEQEEIVRRCEELLSLAAHFEVQCEAARVSIDRLTPSVLAKAFRGELVPQDPNDEPASALLARLRSGKANPDETASANPSVAKRRPGSMRKHQHGG